VDLRPLEVFSKVAELGSFSRAAEALSLTQPTVSEHIRTLEEGLGVRLLDRLGRGAAVTPAGRLLLSYATRLLALHREALQTMAGYQGRMVGHLSVGASTIPGEYLLPAIIGRFKEKFPDISTTLLIGDSQAVVEWVLDGRAEIGVVGAKLGHRALEYRELLPDTVVVAVAASHPWRGRPEVPLEELRTQPLLIRERGSGTRAALEAALADRGLDLSSFTVVGEMGSTQAVKQAVKAGLGVSVISKRAVEEDCRHGLLWCVRLAEVVVARSFYSVLHRERTRSPLAEAFRLFVEAEAGPAA
jgi:DNA-binding transcriptional LysR family regulator